MRFSQRKGIKSAQKIIQRERMDDELRNGLWNLLTIGFWDKYHSTSSYSHNTVKYSNLNNLIRVLWHQYFKKPFDNIPKYWDDCLKEIRDYFFDAEWYEVYEFIEFMANYSDDESSKTFIRYCNIQLEKENSAYRFVNGIITEITSKEEIESIEEAITKSDKYHGVKEHLRTALSLLSDRKNPDYRNSIKESISAIESLSNHITSKENSTFGAALKEIERKKKLHPALKNAFSSLYV